MAVEGAYSITAKSILGDMPGDLVLRLEDGVLVGNVDGMGMSGEIKDGSVNGDSFTCTLEGDAPKGHMTLGVKGKVEGDRISGSLKAGLIKVSFEGERK